MVGFNSVVVDVSLRGYTAWICYLFDYCGI